MKTIAQLIGEPDDPKLEAAVKMFRNEVARLEQAEQQRRMPTIIQIRKMEWEAVKAIIKAYEGVETEKLVEMTLDQFVYVVTNGKNLKGDE